MGNGRNTDPTRTVFNSAWPWAKFHQTFSKMAACKFNIKKKKTAERTDGRVSLKRSEDDSA